MRTLHIKLLRDLRRLWPQALAIAMVMAAGVATLVLGAGAYDSLSTTRARYYETSRFADVFATATRVPAAVATEIAAVDGVAAVDARIRKIALADVADMAEPASVVLVSLPGYHDQPLNRLVMRSGRAPDPEADDQAIASEGFARAHRLEIGSSVHV